jgi:hypothetical protein
VPIRLQGHTHFVTDNAFMQVGTQYKNYWSSGWDISGISVNYIPRCTIVCFRCTNVRHTATLAKDQLTHRRGRPPVEEPSCLTQRTLCKAKVAGDTPGLRLMWRGHFCCCFVSRLLSTALLGTVFPIQLDYEVCAGVIGNHTSNQIYVVVVSAHFDGRTRLASDCLHTYYPYIRRHRTHRSSSSETLRELWRSPCGHH